MSSSAEVALSLRFRGPDPRPEPPDVQAFLRGSAPPVDPRSHRHPEGMGVLRGQARRPVGDAVVVFCQYPTHGIPAFYEPDDASPDVGSWCLRPTVFGYLVSVPRHREPTRSRAAWVMAAWLPLLAPLSAEAAPAREAPTVQRPQRPAVPPAPTDEAAAPTEAEAEPADPTTVEAEPVDPDPTVDPTEDWTQVSPPSAPRPVLEADPGSDQAIVDAAWEGVDGYPVELQLKGGVRMTGRVGAVQRDTFTLIQDETGAVLVLPKSGVLSVKVRVAPPLPSENGSGALIGGSILTTVGTPVFISGLVFLGICPSCVALHLPMLLTGGGAVGGGVALLSRGTRRRRAYREALEQRELVPMAWRTREGWGGGLRFRF